METVLENKLFLIKTLSAKPNLLNFILQYVQQDKIITKRDYSDLNSSNQTPMNIIIDLLDTVMDRGDATCCKFVDLLKRKEVQENFPDLKERFIPSPTSHNQDNPVEAANEVDDCYPVTRRPLGHCLIINNHTFEDRTRLSTRKGTDADRDALTEVFLRMHFIVEERRDLVSSDMQNTAKEFAAMDHSRMDAFVCCILSHGEKGTVFGIDGESVAIRDLTLPFAECSTLTGKPKLFFIQACQGKDLQKGVLMHDGSEDELEDDYKKADFTSVPLEADFLIGMSTVESYKSFRHTTEGSIYIQDLCKHLKVCCPKKEDILSILTKVNRSVSAKDLKRHKQMPEPRYTLTRKLVLPMD
ncbi:hypothetical protein AMELA_G00166580 [Ameiurus melas]|uniref:Caspase-8 n=1 Tax=Ameiurus melas TaxID=219545 RepID=A0A7J6AB98_AMEME|nr:hypothetical protein AMELA_G00166580 [Ameiurus melas]